MTTGRINQVCNDLSSLTYLTGKPWIDHWCKLSLSDKCALTEGTHLKSFLQYFGRPWWPWTAFLCASAHPVQNQSINNVHQYPQRYQRLVKCMLSHCSTHILWPSNATTHTLPNGLTFQSLLSFPLLSISFSLFMPFLSKGLHLGLPTCQMYALALLNTHSVAK